MYVCNTSSQGLNDAGSCALISPCYTMKTLLQTIKLISKMDDHLKIISQLTFFNTIVVCEFNNEVIIFWSKASHCFTPLAIIRTVI